MAEMFGRVEGCSRGRGGSMHVFDVAHRFYGGNAIVGGGLPLAVGSGPGRPPPAAASAVTAVFFGEGAVAEGEFHECMNLAALWDLPVLFVCENNLYAMGTALARSQVGDRPGACGPPATGCRPGPSTAWTWPRWRRPRSRAVESIRAGGGPHFLECRTYRFRAHSMYDPELYRERSEVEQWKERDPLDAARRPAASATAC